MCGRYSLAADMDLFAKYFEVFMEGVEYSPRYNIAPGQNAPVVTGSGEKGRLSVMRWGLTPEWMKEKKGGRLLINARAETLYQKPTFRRSLENRRCLIPADGFYEWTKQNGAKLPMRIVLPDIPVFAFAGIWDEALTDRGLKEPSFCIITTAASKEMAAIHSRMPAILPDKGLMKHWLDNETPTASLLQLLRPYQGRLTLYPVSRRVNSPLHDDPECIKPVSW
jgi:putative SOS response-associated peptidase YedK